jgi:hypothetical protein
MPRRRGKDSGKQKPRGAGTPPQPSEMQRRKAQRDERSEVESQRDRDPDAIDRDDLKSH